MLANPERAIQFQSGPTSIYSKGISMSEPAIARYGRIWSSDACHRTPFPHV
jgi:hypothetical protein